MSWLEIWAMIQVIGIAIPIVIILFVFSFVIGVSIKQSIKQARCKHTYYLETRACDAVCNQCGKNLGFIGTLKKQRSGS